MLKRGAGTGGHGGRKGPPVTKVSLKPAPQVRVDVDSCSGAKDSSTATVKAAAGATWASVDVNKHVATKNDHDDHGAFFSRPSGSNARVRAETLKTQTVEEVRPPTGSGARGAMASVGTNGKRSFGAKMHSPRRRRGIGCRSQ